jgi:catechol 2,3-dioxygenase-like lactoylglutathione lyase family enzyme
LEKPEAIDGSRIQRRFEQEVHMLKSISISGVFVLDQDEALDFYVHKLGLEVSNDLDLGFMRWLTVRVPGEPGRDILLEKPGPPAMDEASTEQVRELVTKGATGFAVGFTTDDCQKTYETLKTRGVEFTQEPTEHFYGTDIGIRDPFGNNIRIVQLAPVPEQNPSDLTPADFATQEAKT